MHLILDVRHHLTVKKSPNFRVQIPLYGSVSNLLVIIGGRSSHCLSLVHEPKSEPTDMVILPLHINVIFMKPRKTIGKSDLELTKTLTGDEILIRKNRTSPYQKDSAHQEKGSSC